MKGGRGRKKPIRSSTWRDYLSAEFHRLLDSGALRKWNKVLAESERPEHAWDWEDGDALTEQVVAEIWEQMP